MHHAHAAKRSATNLSIDVELVKEARRLGLNLSRLLEERLREAIAAERRRCWLEDNEQAFAAYERFVESHGLFNEAEREW